MKTEEAIKWVDDRMCFGRGTFTEHHPPNIDECWQAGAMAIRALKMYGKLVRCKDCIHYESDGGAMMICNVTDMVCDNDDYCSYGERIEESEVEE